MSKNAGFNAFLRMFFAARQKDSPTKCEKGLPLSSKPVGLF